MWSHIFPLWLVGREQKEVAQKDRLLQQLKHKLEESQDMQVWSSLSLSACWQDVLINGEVLISLFNHMSIKPLPET